MAAEVTAASRSDRGRPLGRGFAPSELSAVFELLARVARAAVATIGPDSEAVVHDLRNPEHSVVAIAGHLTGRNVGAPVPDPQLLPGAVDAFADDDLRRRATTATGRELVASTVWVRDQGDHIVGALCINVDVAGLQRARELIDRHLGGDDTTGAVLPTFAADVVELTRSVVAEVLGPGQAHRRLRKSERVALIRHLQQQGVFALRGAASAVAAEIGVSRASIYADLHGVSGNTSAVARKRDDVRQGRSPSRPHNHRSPAAGAGE